MKSTLALALALAAIPCLASAGGTIKVHPGLVMQPVRTQIRDAAKAAGYFAKGSGQSLRLKTVKDAKIGTVGLVQASIWGKGGWAPGTGRVENAHAKFKLHQAIEGVAAVAVKQNGSVWQPIFYATNPTVGK